MSAYGHIQTSKSPRDALKSSVWRISSSSSTPEFLVIFHLTAPIASLPENSSLISFLHKEFAEEVARGRTYPQEIIGDEGYSRDAFENYFFAGDGVFLALRFTAEELLHLQVDVNQVPVIDGEGGQVVESNLDLKAIGHDRDWEETVAGFYYIKPNYPGRSSHICNAGFVTPLSARGKGYARILARSYLHYAPLLGYKASVFNLVYVNNVASIRLWEKLNFTKAGRIPRAGRLKTADGEREEFVDAWVFYKSFEDAVEA